MTREHLENPGELEDAAMRERLRAFYAKWLGIDVEELDKASLELSEEFACLFAKSELSRAGGERAGIGAAAWVEGYAELEHEVLKFGTAHLYTKEGALIPAARLIRELSQERDEARRRLAAIESSCKLFEQSAQSWHGLVDLLQTHPGRRDGESAPAFAERLIKEQDDRLAAIEAARAKRRAADKAERLQCAVDEIERRYLEWANSDDDSDEIAVALVDSLGELISKAKAGAR